MKKHKFQIQGKEWTAEFLTEEEFAIRCLKSPCYRGAAAITLTGSRRICFDLSEITRDVVRHEVWHAYNNQLFINSAELSIDQYEEVCADLFGEMGPEMLDLSSTLYRIARKEIARHA